MFGLLNKLITRRSKVHRALVLSAGEGSRLQPITANTPKSLAPISETPVMDTLIDLLRCHGLNQIMINTFHHAEQIEARYGNGAQFGVEIGYSFEGRLKDGVTICEPVGSAGAIQKIHDHSEFFDDTFVVRCGDAIIDIDLTELIRRHRESGALLTVSLCEVPLEKLSRYGVAQLGEKGRVVAFVEKPSVAEAPSRLVNTGVYVMEPSVLRFIPPDGSYDIGGQLIPDMINRGLPVSGVSLPLSWTDIGCVQDYYDGVMNALVGKSDNIPQPGCQIAPGIHAGLNVRVDLSRCYIERPVHIGSGTIIAPGERISGPCSIGRNCIIEARARISQSIVMDNTRIGSGAYLERKIVSPTYSVTPDGDNIAPKDVGMEWLVSDSRAAVSPPSGVHLHMLQTLWDDQLEIVAPPQETAL